MAQPTESVRPYADLIESTYGNTQTRLVQFLRQGYGYRILENQDPHTNIYILDSINSSLTSQHFRPHRLDEVSSQFQTALVSRPPSSETRILLVQSAQLGDMSTAYLDAIGWHFQLDPSFFCAFIEVGLYSTEGDDITGPRQLPISLPSENDFITIATDTNSSFAIFSIKREDTLNTVIMLSFDHHSENQIKDFHTHLISQPRDVITATNTNPCDFLLFYIRRSLNKSASLARRHAYIKPSLESERPLSGFLWERNQANLRNLLSSRKSLLRYLRRNFPDVQKSQPCLASVIPDYDFVIDDTRENATQLQSLLQTYTSLQAIKESKRGLEQADAVRRITLVGMVFIPLSFATSFFGMNFEQLGAGTLHIGFFVLLAALSGLVAWLLAVSIGPAETMWTRARNRYGEREFGFVDNYDWVTKRMVFWGWMCRKSSVANSLYKLWVDERDQIMVDADEDNEANIPRLRRKVALRLILLLFRRGKKKLKDLNNFMLRKHSTGNSPIDIADSEAPSQQVTSS